MNVLFINPKTYGYNRPISIPLGLLSIASVLKSRGGYNVRIYDRVINDEPVSEYIKNFKPDIVGVSLMSFKSVDDALSVSQFFEELSVPVVWGGPLASELYSAALKHKCIAAVSMSEGEETWLELVGQCEKNDRDYSKIAGLALRSENGDVYLTETRPFVDLGSLPPLDWSLIDVPSYFQSHFDCTKMLYLYIAKGCPNDCAFCYNKDFHRCCYRERPLEHVLDEIKFLNKEYGLNGIYFADELFGKNKKELRRICDGLRSLNIKLAWGCQTRVGMFDRDDFQYMYDSGCRWILFGVESGSKRILKEMNKKIPYDKIIPTFDDCRKSGINPIGSFIIGYPGEKVEDLKETVKIIKALNTTLINTFYFAICPGSDVYKKLIADGEYEEITDIRKMSEISDQLDRLEKNFSEIPDIDLKVVRSWFLWKSFFTKNTSENAGKYSFAMKAIHDALQSVARTSFVEMVMTTFYSAREFLEIGWYANAYPKIIKKYNLR